MTAAGADVVARFEAAWARSLDSRATAPPRLADYVPDGTLVRVAVLADLVRIDLRQRWDRDGSGKRITEYRKEFPEVDQSAQLAELVYEEYLLRCRQGPLDVATFLADYPEVAGELHDRLVALGDLTESDLAAATALLAELAPGQRIDDFDLLTELGTGVLGRVFLARQISMQRLVTVRLSTGAELAPRTMAQLDHPHIVRVFDQRVLDSSARLVYMQYLPGGTARGVLEQRRRGAETDGGALLLRAVDAAMEAKGEIRQADSRVRAELATLSWPETVAWVGRRLADALDYAARQGVLHGAVKPANVVFTAEGVPKLADFALHGGRSSAPPIERMAQDNSLPYRAPEELARALDPTAPAPDARSDIYALGALLWEMLTGTPPFEDTASNGGAGGAANIGPSVGGRSDNGAPGTRADSARTDLTAALDRRRGGVDTAALERIPADCPAALRRVLLTCLEPDPDRRWPGGAELAQQLDLCLDPRARDLADPPEHSWRRRLRRWRIPLVTLAIAVPNALASVYNVQHNNVLMHYRQTAEAQHRFEIFTAVVNFAGFSIGSAVLVYLCRYLIMVPHGLRLGVRYDPAILHRTRTDALALGDRAVLVIFSIWMLSGISFPIALHETADGVSAADYLHFVALHAISGATALTYPFFLVTFYLVRCIYPMLLSHGEIREDEAVRLRRLRRRCAFYLSLAASIPLLAVAGATLLAPSDLAEIIVNVRVMCVASIVAFGVAYLLFRALERDLRALERVIAP